MSLKVISIQRECNQGQAIFDENIPVNVSGTPVTVEYDMNGVGFSSTDESSISINHNNVAVFSEIDTADKVKVKFISKDGNSYSLLNETLSIDILTEE